MKKRVLSLLLVLLMVVSLVPISALADRSNTDVAYAVERGNIYFDKAKGTITDCDGSVTKASIPAEIDGVAVTSIGEDAFLSCTSLTGVTIPNSVTRIGDRAFRNCTSLASIDIPNSVTNIGSNVFNYCDGLENVDVENDNPKYMSLSGVLFTKDMSTLMKCPSRKSGTYRIPEGVVSIDDGAFQSCMNLTDIYSEQCEEHRKRLVSGMRELTKNGNSRRSNKYWRWRF